MKLVDTDVLMWNFRGDRLAAQLLDAAPGVGLSSVTYMELVQGMRNKVSFNGCVRRCTIGRRGFYR